jgi:hypothetical protein
MGVRDIQRGSGRWGLPACLLAAVLSVAPLLAGAPAQAAGNLVVVSAFTNSGEELDVATYTEGSQTVGLVGMKGANDLRVSITFNKKELATFIALVQRAIEIRSDGWKQAGSFSETETKSPSHIIVYGGPSLQFSLSDPSVGSLDFTLNAGDISGFVAALNQAEGQLNP